MKITKRQLKKIIKEATLDSGGEQVMSADYLREIAYAKIDKVLNDFYNDLVEDAGVAPEEAQEKMQDLIDTFAMHSQQGFIGMPI